MYLCILRSFTGAPLSATTQQARDNLQQQLQQQLGQPQIRTQVPQIVNQSQPVLQPQPGVVRPLAPPGVGGGQLQPLPPLQHLQQQQQIRQQQQAQNIQHQQTIQQPQVQQLQQPQQQIQPQQQPMAPDQQQQQPKKGLSLTVSMEFIKNYFLLKILLESFSSNLK